jgi:hypothetical protein
MGYVLADRPLQNSEFHVLDQGQTPRLPNNSNFDHLINIPNIIAADKTSFIEELDKDPQYQLMFLRPRRWGKSSFLRMLADYYDMSKADEFDGTFGDLYIGKHPTAARSSLLVLLFDFSDISTFESPHQTRKDLNAMMLRVLRNFLETNERFLGYPNPESLLSGDGDGADALQIVLVSLLIAVFAFWLIRFYVGPCKKAQTKALCWSRRVRRSC